jgi:hypothetical protein
VFSLTGFSHILLLPLHHLRLAFSKSPSCVNMNVNALCVHVRVCMRAWHFSHCSHLFVLARLGVLPTILHPHCHPRTKTQQRHNNDTTTMRSLLPPSPLPSPSSSVTTRGQKCACSYDDVKMTTMRPTMTMTMTRNDTMHAIVRVVPSLILSLSPPCPHLSLVLVLSLTPNNAFFLTSASGSTNDADYAVFSRRC